MYGNANLSHFLSQDCEFVEVDRPGGRRRTPEDAAPEDAGTMILLYFDSREREFVVFCKAGWSLASRGQAGMRKFCKALGPPILAQSRPETFHTFHLKVLVFFLNQ